jgi:hydroxymethylglutaryl-CoA lyase
MVHPKWVPQFPDADEVLTRVRALGLDGLVTAAFVPNRRGLDRALAVGVDEVSFAIASTDKLSEANFRMGRAAATDEVLQAAALAREARADVSVTIGGAFGCPYEGDVTPEHVADMARGLVDGGIEVVLLADTIGNATVGAVERIFGLVAEECPSVELGAHFHGGEAALACVAAAVDQGATVLDAALGGFGGCPFVPSAPGNVPTEAVVGWLGEDRAAAVAACGLEVSAMIAEERRVGAQAGG